jgi:uncharacterized protein YkwD
MKLQYILLTVSIAIICILFSFLAYVFAVIGTAYVETVDIALKYEAPEYTNKNLYINALPQIPDKPTSAPVALKVEEPQPAKVQESPQAYQAPVVVSKTAKETVPEIIEESQDVIVRLTQKENALEKAINAIRVANNLPELIPENCLRDASEIRAEEMFDGNYFSHARPDGSRFWSGLYCDYISRGENLAKKLKLDAPDNWMIDSWMMSPTHRAIILDAKWQYIGITTVGNITAMEVGL